MAYEDEVRKRLSDMVQRRAMGAVPPVAPPVAPVAPVAPPTTAAQRMAATVPALRGAAGRSLGAISKAARVAGPVAAGAVALGTEGLGTLEVATDPTKTKLDVATRGAEGVARLASAGAGAGIGFAGGGPLGALAGGAAGYLAPDIVFAIRDYLQGRTPSGNVAPTAAPVAAPVAAEAPFVPPPGAVNAETLGQANLQTAAAPGFGARRPFTSADIDNGRVPAPGTGVIRNNATGRLIQIDSPPPPAAVSAEPPLEPGYQGIRGYVGALMNQRRAAQTEAQKMATALKMPELYKTTAEAAKLEAIQKLAAAEPDPVKKAAILSGYAPAESSVTVPQGYMGDFTKDIPVITTKGPGAGTVRLTQPLRAGQVATAADLAADIKRLGSRAAVLAEYKRRNITPPKE